ncbi:MAG: DinB family protein [Saprospiraceae bacterium]|nr:DinB family protein [Candidatus Vicinibacter proximus]MBL7823723.1 DinB family protein [Saprospiraceae bacterium]MCC6841832.1 DinB family protein [Saprospiraceae bacterium]HRG32892.1 DinB family protein [Saprospiraceae bacterium]
MNRQELINQFTKNHQEFVEYVQDLSDEKLMFSPSEKWNAGQQLNHIYLCLLPIEQALASKEYILNKFGLSDHSSLPYEEIVKHYINALNKGGKAPDRFVPETFDLLNRPLLTSKLYDLLLKIGQHFENYSEEELDSLVLPHPLLGRLTIRELFYVMTDHAVHHHKQVIRNLEEFHG